MRRYFVVSFEMPDGASVERARAYVEGAVAEMSGCLQPYDPDNEDEMERGDPMQGLDGDSVSVTVRRPTR